MIGNVIKLEFRRAAPEAEKVFATGRFRTETEARAWWQKHDAENPFEVMLRARFREHREIIFRRAAQLLTPPQPRPPLHQLLRLILGA